MARRHPDIRRGRSGRVLAPARALAGISRWRRDNRGGGGGGEEDTLAAFRQRKQRDYESMGLAQLAAAPDFDETIRKMWTHEQARRQREHSTIREAAAGDFEGYVAAARDRLRDHGCAEEFRPAEDPR